jgi:large subunit ribosomal protein L18e
MKKVNEKMKSNSLNDDLIGIIIFLNKEGRSQKAPIWGDLAKRLAASRKNRKAVNLSKIRRHTKARDVVAIPGKLLGAGTIGHAVTVAALSFSNSAREKITKAGGKCISFEELIKKNPKGKNVKIMRGV